MKKAVKKKKRKDEFVFDMRNPDELFDIWTNPKRKKMRVALNLVFVIYAMINGAFRIKSKE